VENIMKRIWTLGTLAAFVVAIGSFVAAQQATTKPAAQKPAVKKEAKTEKEDDEKDEAKKAGAKVQLPAPVASAFKKAYPDAVIKGSSKETENGKTVYEVESVDKGLNRDLLYAADGTVIECEEQVKEADVPAPVIAALKQLYPKATITKAERTTKGQALQYDLALKGAPKPEVSFLPDGKPVPAAPEKK
jgi:hypothetical protein